MHRTTNNKYSYSTIMCRALFYLGADFCGVEVGVKDLLPTSRSEISSSSLLYIASNAPDLGGVQSPSLRDPEKHGASAISLHVAQASPRMRKNTAGGEASSPSVQSNSPVHGSCRIYGRTVNELRACAN